MHILLIGANGRSAQAILPRLLEIKEVQLTLFLRRSERLQHLYNDRVRLVEGDANKVDDLVSALPGIDLVINTMGGMDLDRKTRNLVHAMENAQVQRLVALYAGGIYEELPEPLAGTRVWWVSPGLLTSEVPMLSKLHHSTTPYCAPSG
ncbi:MAG: hypothetical protein Sw1PiTSA_37430 [Shewanella algae]|uniref:NAD(P)H-binding protein n=1 Tax=Shewanella algae TaxID=38313 RepID=UPI001AADA8D2|nr:NAD(P)H-binding protein [Shewanella algae]MBO2669396.1 NAD(P)H-binding protein [Shewanella algae]